LRFVRPADRPRRQTINGATDLGTASDSYLDNDRGVNTITDSTTTSHDSFTLDDTDSISGYLSSATGSSVSGSVNYSDRGHDDDIMDACGSHSSSGDKYTFTDNESTNDDFVLSIQDPGVYHGVATDYAQSTLTMTGTTSTGPSGSSFSYSVPNS